MIPKIIWQTYKTRYEDLPTRAKECSQLWQTMNPDYQYGYMDDVEMINFVKGYYGQDMVDLINSFKVPVMKADLWRILVIYQFGGIYSDIDTYPTRPIDQWLPLDKNFVAAVEHGTHYAQWAFMASPKSPITKSILDVIIERCQNIDYGMKEFIHYHTANDAFTEGIRRYLKLPNLDHECIGMNMVNNCFDGFIQNETLTYHLNKNIKDAGFYCFGGTEWDAFTKGYIVHEFGSVFWNRDEYQSWGAHPLIDPKRGVREQ